MSNTNSPYQKPGMLSSDHAPAIIAGGYAPAIVPFDDHMFEQQLNIPEMGAYDLDFHNFLATNCAQPQSIPGPSLLNTSVAHLTPVSDSTPDFYDCITPLSLQTPFEFHSAHRPQAALTSINTSIEALPSRPRSSPGVIGPSPPNPWSIDSSLNNDGLGIRIAPPRTTPAPSPKRQHKSSVSSVSDIISPPRANQWTPILPNPAGIIQMRNGIKRTYSEDDFENSPISKRKRSPPPSPSSNANLDMDPENQLLLRLREKENLSWKEVQTRFENEMGKSYRIATLQMRLTRLRERMRTWTDVDVQALRMAHDYWLNNKFEIMASKINDFGATEKWTSKQCYKKWQEIGFPSDNIFATHINQTPTFVQSYSSSPAEEPAHAFQPNTILSDV